MKHNAWYFSAWHLHGIYILCASLDMIQLSRLGLG